MNGLGDAIMAAVGQALMLALLAGVVVGACGTCAVQKASEYRIVVEKPAPSSRPEER
jgi:hypothetical protein